MTRWRKGEGTIERLLQTRHLDQVPGDTDIPTSLIGAARRHVTSARGCSATDPEGAYALAYDAARKAATALLAYQGLRPTSVGGHIAVVEAIQAQFPDVPGLRSLDRLRRRRNQAEYPDPAGYDPITEEEADEVVDVAEHAVESTIKLLELPQLGVF
jgi:hypothetical protein